MSGRQLAGWARGGGPRRQNVFQLLMKDQKQLGANRRWSGPSNAGGTPPANKAVVPHSTAPRSLRGRLHRDGASIGEHLLCPGPLVVVANMASQQDPARILRALPVGRRRHTLVVLRRPSLKQALLLPMAEVNVDRPRIGGGRLISWLRRGGTVLVFPEAESSTDGELGGFHPFAAELARQAEVPIAPAAVSGSFSQQATPTVRFGAPIPVDPYETLASRAHQAVASLLAESDTSWWAELTNGEEPEAAPAEPWQRIWSNSEPVSDERTRPAIWGSGS